VPGPASRPLRVPWQAARAAENQAASNEQAKQQQQALNTFYRGYGACMEGRGYTIK
jgi:hypothetical protein